MNKVVPFIFLVCLIISFNSCTKDADVKLPKVESKLVISSFISPQDTIVKVEVSLSQPLYNNSNSNQYSNVSNAIVQINDGTNTQSLVYNSNEDYYSVSTSLFPIVVGATYSLTVSTPDGKNINAITSIPSLNSTLAYSYQALNDPNSPNQYYIDASWNDAPGNEDYYRISYYGKYYYSGSNDTSYTGIFSENFSDKDHDGRAFNQNFEVYKTNSASNSGEMYLIHATKEYYLFHSKLNAMGFNNPFSEPVQMYSNINGGYGIFAGFNQYKLQVFL